MQIQSTKVAGKQQGMVLITVLVMLLIITLLGVSSLRSSASNLRVAGATSEYYSTFQAAETGLALADYSSDFLTLASNSKLAANAGQTSTVAIDANETAAVLDNTSLVVTATIGDPGMAPGNTIGPAGVLIFTSTVNRLGSGASTVHQKALLVTSGG